MVHSLETIKRINLDQVINHYQTQENLPQEAQRKLGELIELRKQGYHPDLETLADQIIINLKELKKLKIDQTEYPPESQG